MPKFVWRNLQEENERLGYEWIPEHAIQLKKTKLHKRVQLVYFLVIMVVSFGVLFITRYSNGHLLIGRLAILGGIILGILSGIPHEILHGIVMPKDSVVYIGMNKNRIGMYEYCARGTRKGIFVLSSAMPILLGIIPFIIFLCTELQEITLSGVLWGFSSVVLISVCSDVADIIFMLIYVPHHHYIQPGNGFYVHYSK